MKKNVLWMCAALLTSGLALTSCSTQDDPVLSDQDYFDEAKTLYDFEDGTVFTSDSRITAATVYNAEKDGMVASFVGASNAQNGYSFAHFDFSDKVERAAHVTLTFDYWNVNGNRSILTIGDAMVRGNHGGSEKTTYNGTGGIFRIGSDKNNAFVNDSLFALEDLCDKWLTVEVTVHNFDRTVEYTVKEGDNVIIETEEPVAFYKEDANECTQIDVFGYINNGTNCYLDDLSLVSSVDTRIHYYDYTIKYVNAEGEEVKEPATRNGREGTIATLLAADKASCYNEDHTKKYIYLEDDAENTPIAEDAVITVKFRDAEKYQTVLNCYVEGTTNRVTDVIRGEQFEGDNLVVQPAIGYEYNGGYYFTTPTSYNGVSYTFTGNENKTGGYIFGTLYYNKVDTVAYFADIETLIEAGNVEGTVVDLIGWTGIAGTGLFDRFSQGMGPRLGEGAYVWTAPLKGGTYNVTLYGRAGGSVAEAPALYVRDTAGTLTKLDIEVPTWGAAVTGSILIEGVVVPDGYSLVLMNDGNAMTLDMDTISMALVD